MLIVFTDLDGTLLDRETYSFEPARPVLDMLKELAVPLVICSSKTRAEVEIWREQLSNDHPFAVENGGAVYVPRGYFPAPFLSPGHRDDYHVFEFGAPYPELVQTLRLAAAESHCRVRGFYDMSVEEVSQRCRLPLRQAVLAKKREYDEAFEILDPRADLLLSAIVRQKKRWTRGGGFYHVSGPNDKAHGVHLLRGYYRRTYGNVLTVGLGDGLNDVAFLNAVDIPIILPSESSGKLRSAVRRGRVADAAGPEGWNNALLAIIKSNPPKAVAAPEPDLTSAPVVFNAEVAAINM